MEKQDLEQYEDEPAPSYEESASTSYLDEKTAQRSTLLQGRVAEIRQQRVQLLINGHVAPLLEDAMLQGRQSQAIIIVPADAITTDVVLTAKNLVHRPKSASTNVIQLQGPNGTEAFWTHPKTAESLEAAVRNTLRDMMGTSKAIEAPPPRSADLESPISGQKSWLKRTFGVPGPDHDPTASTGHWNLGWRSDEEDLRLVRMREVSFRTETEMGLLATSTVKCVVVDVVWDS